MNIVADEMLTKVPSRLLSREGLEELRSELETNLKGAHDGKFQNGEAVIGWCNVELAKVYRELERRR